MIVHLKHVLIAAGALLLCWSGVRAYVDMRVKLATITSGAAENIKANERSVQAAQVTIDAATTGNQQIDQQARHKLADLQRQLDSRPDSAQIRSIVQAALPGVKTVDARDAQGNALIAVADTQANRDAINQADVAFKTCRFDLDDCRQKQQNFQSIIDAQRTQLSAKDDTIKEQGNTIRELKSFGKGGNFWGRTGRVLLPVGCAGAGAYLGATKGSKGATVGALAGGGVCAVTFRF
jgi:hypothetical protein